jgi:hypothetical protein
MVLLAEALDVWLVREREIVLRGGCFGESRTEDIVGVER